MDHELEPYLRADEAPTQAEREKMPEHEFGDPENKKYPLDNPGHIRAAASYVEKEHNAGRLSDAKYKEIVARINKAKKAHSIGEENQDGSLAAKTVQTGDSTMVRRGYELDPRWERVQRVDLASGEELERKRTPQGGLVVRANMTRTGVFTYRNADGTTRREYRPPDEVFHPDSLKTLAHATYTDDHPEKVTPDNWRRVATGHVAGTPHRAGKFVQGDIHIQHRDAIDKAEAGRHQELSCGYECAIDPTSGVSPDGEEYDVIQRNIRYNHVAAGPRGWGRAGPDVRLHLDGGACVSVDGAALPPNAKEGGRYVRGMDELEKLRQDAADQKTRADSLQQALDKLTGEVTILRKSVSDAEAAKAQVAQAKRDDSAFDEQLAALEEARRWLGPEWSRKRADGSRKTVADIRREIVAELQPQVNLDGLSDAVIEGMYIGAVHQAESAARGRADMAGLGLGLSSFVVDGKEPPQFMKGKKKPDDDEDEDDEDTETKKAQDAMFQRMKDAYKRPRGDRRRFGRDSGQTVPMRPAFNGGNQGNAAGGFGGGN